MQRVFFRNLAILVALNVLIKPLWILGIDRTVQNTVGQSNYGIYFALFNLSFLSQIFLDLGISSYNNKHLSQFSSELKNYFSRLFTIKLLLSFLYLFITIVAGYFLRLNTYQLYMLLALCFNQILASLIIYVRSNISALHFFVVDSFLSIMDKAIMIIFCSILLFTNLLNVQFSIEWFIGSQTAAYFITLIFSILWLSKHSGWLKFSFDKLFTIQLLKDCLPFALLIFLMGIYNKTDGVMIERLLGDNGSTEAGVYASAYRLVDAMNQFGYLFAALLLPIFSRMLVQKKSIENLAKTSFTSIFVFAWISCLLLFSYRIQVMHLLYHETSDYSGNVLGLIIFSFIGSSSIYIFSTLLTANGNLKQLILIAVSGTLLNLGGNYFLIQKFGAGGAAIMCSITQISVAVLQIILSKKIFGFRFNHQLIFKLGIYCLVTTGFIFGLRSLYFSWIIQIGIGAIVMLLVSFVLKLFRINDVLQLVKPENTN